MVKWFETTEKMIKEFTDIPCVLLRPKSHANLSLIENGVIEHGRAKQTAKQFVSIKYKSGYMDREISGLTIV